MQHESDLQRKIINYFKARKIYVVNTHGSVWGGNGTPDLIVCYEGRFIAFETKFGKGRLRPEQKVHRERILESGGRFYSPRTFEEFLGNIQEVFNEPKNKQGRTIPTDTKKVG